MQDHLFIESIECETIIGCLAWERQVKQKVVVDLTLFMDIASVAKSDDLNTGVDYVAAAEWTKAFVEKSDYKYIETLVHDLADGLLAAFTLHSVKIRLNKPGAVAVAKNVGVEIYRSSS